MEGLSQKEKGLMDMHNSGDCSGQGGTMGHQGSIKKIQQRLNLKIYII